MKQKEERGAFSQSFVMGVIALVFLIVGYQTALFLHNAAVTKIVANRDEPDTVYIYKEYEKPVEVRTSQHSGRAEEIRRKVPRKKVESFRFNPNTASLDELCRLGFSPKQAQAIDNYRKKGGHFSRKSDFAESFVVSDSIFKRLEPFIDIPLLDLNKADSAALDALPGIGSWYAKKILEHRNALGSYSYPEQLMDIRNFDKQKYDNLADLITVEKENIKPYKIWTLPIDSLRLHPYIGDYAAKGIVLYRDNNPKDLWTLDALVKAGIIKAEYAPKLLRCFVEEQ